VVDGRACLFNECKHRCQLAVDSRIERLADQRKTTALERAEFKLLSPWTRRVTISR